MTTYTIQVPVMMTLIIEANTVSEALDEAAEQFQDAVIEMECEFQYTESWEDAQAYDENGNLVEEE